MQTKVWYTVYKNGSLVGEHETRASAEAHAQRISGETGVSVQC
jgi:hypothetical protein